jgi:hypothetical protein
MWADVVVRASCRWQGGQTAPFRRVEQAWDGKVQASPARDWKARAAAGVPGGGLISHFLTSRSYRLHLVSTLGADDSGRARFDSVSSVYHQSKNQASSPCLKKSPVLSCVSLDLRLTRIRPAPSSSGQHSWCPTRNLASHTRHRRPPHYHRCHTWTQPRQPSTTPARLLPVLIKHLAHSSQKKTSVLILPAMFCLRRFVLCPSLPIPPRGLGSVVSHTPY